MPQVNASPDAMRELALNIGKNIKAIAEYNADLAGKLNALGDSFQDEGIDIIRDHVHTTRKRMEDVLPAFQSLMGKLVEVANLYKGSQQAITGETREGLNWGMALAVPAVVLGLGAGAQAAVNTPLIDSNQEFAVTRNTRPVAHNYKSTLQKWRKEADGSMTYDAPEETGKNLDYRQGKVEGYKGTCGVVSSGNVLAMAGIKTTEADLVKYCSENFAGFNETICETGSKISDDNGGTRPRDRQLILAHYGVQSELVPQMVETTGAGGTIVKTPNIDGIGRAVESGKGVIISVDVTHIWKNGQTGPHAVTVTSVTRDKDGGINGFWVTDSGSHQPAVYHSKDTIEKSLTDREMNVTKNIIR
jgi:uncharacterized protein YukE